MAQQSEFILAVNQIAFEHGIQVEVVLSALEESIKTAYMKLSPNIDESSIKVVIDREIGIPTLYINGKKTDVDLGRIAAQSAKQVIQQKIRDAENDMMFEDFNKDLGTLQTGVVQRMQGSDVFVEVGKAIAFMPYTETIPTERYRSGMRIKVFLLESDREKNRMIVSRGSIEFIKALFKQEVPEIASGEVEIVSIAREAGLRSKVSVRSKKEGLDAIGACVGQRGVRIDSIMNEIGTEKIDMIEWNDDQAIYIKNALSPAKPYSITTFDVSYRALCYVPNEQLSLAIGKDGQNVRLAAKLTGWDIDIRSQEDEEKANKGDIFSNLSVSIRKKLEEANIADREGLEKIVSGEIKVKGIGSSAIEVIKSIL